MTDKLIEALVKAQSEINHAVQDAANPFFKSDYASLKEVIDSVKGHLNDNGIYMQQVSHDMPHGCCVETVFYGHGGSLSSGKVSIPATKNDPQMFGSALSYAKRYSLQMACAIATQKEDDDAEKAMLGTKHGLSARAGKYKLFQPDGETIIDHTNDANDFVDICRRHIGDPKKQECQDIYASSKWMIKAAQKEARKKESKDVFAKMIDAYEGESNEPTES